MMLTKPEDVDSDMEDHAPDEGRYACMSRPWIRPNREDDKPKNQSGYKSSAPAGGSDWKATL
jgi:hypothetical protein